MSLFIQLSQLNKFDELMYPFIFGIWKIALIKWTFWLAESCVAIPLQWHKCLEQWVSSKEKRNGLSGNAHWLQGQLLEY